MKFHVSFYVYKEKYRNTIVSHDTCRYTYTTKVSERYKIISNI